MSLKSRLRIAISALMAAVVIGLSLLYIQGFLSNEFDRTVQTAKSIAGQVQGTVRARLETENPPGTTKDERKAALLGTVRSDQRIRRMLARALGNWPLVSEVYLTDARGHVLASSTEANAGKEAAPLASIGEWEHRSAFENAINVFLSRQDVEQAEPLAAFNETEPFVITHAVISMAFLRHTLYPPLTSLGIIFAVSLLLGIVFAILLPNLALGPLEQLGERMELMAQGDFPTPSDGPKRAGKEVAAVYSKLDMLGRQFLGARENADDLRTNVEHMLERLEQAVMLVDPSGRLIIAGTNAERMLGTPDGHLSGRPLAELVAPESELGVVLAGVTASRAPVSDRLVSVETPEGTRTLSVSCEPLERVPGGRSIGMMITLRDPETRGQIEAELGLAGRLAALSRLTRGVAHEIKNPLNAITLHLEVLRSRLEEPAPEVDVISREISRLDRVVKTFLDFNRPVEPEMRPVDLSDIAREIGKLVSPQAKQKQIAVRIEAGSATVINGDIDLLKQAVLNVVMNAIDAMPGGGSLTIATLRHDGECALQVTDTGAGIPEEVQDRIFSLFFSTKKQGSGIGLAIAYRFVQLHDGRLEFSSQAGVGTTFRFTFPEAVFTSRSSNLAMSRSHGA